MYYLVRSAGFVSASNRQACSPRHGTYIHTYVGFIISGVSYWTDPCHPPVECVCRYNTYIHTNLPRYDTFSANLEYYETNYSILTPGEIWIIDAPIQRVVVLSRAVSQWAAV